MHRRSGTHFSEPHPAPLCACTPYPCYMGLLRCTPDKHPSIRASNHPSLGSPRSAAEAVALSICIYI